MRQASRTISVAVAAGLLLAAGAAFGQTAAPAKAPKLEFDVASVRAVDMAQLQQDMQAGKFPRFGVHVDGLRFVDNVAALKELIAYAYKVKVFQVTGPDWLNTERFNITATMPEGSTKDDGPAMMQALLHDRFELKAHRDAHDQSVLALVVGKDGPKLKVSPAAGAPIDPEAPLAKGEMQVDGPDGPVRMTTHPDGSFTENMGAKGTVTGKMDAATQSIHMTADTVTMDGFADMLTGLMQMGGSGGRQVIDMTGLKGNYQVSIDISIASLIAAARAQGADVPAAGAAPGVTAGSPPVAEASDPGGGTDINKTVAALGLKLEPRKAAVEQLIVDSVEKTPTEN